MGLTAGIVGLPNVGKSTLFNAITKKNILAANYPFATIEPNVGIVTVKDERLEYLAEKETPERVIPTAYEFIDIAGLVKGASKGEGLGNKFLSHIREVDAICEVVRCFKDPNITHVEGDIDPIRDIVDLELIISDLDIANNRLDKIEKKAVTSKDKEALEEVSALRKVKYVLEQNIPARRLDYTEDENKILKNFNLLTKKPIIYMANVSEEDINKGNEYVELVKEHASKENAKVVMLSAKVESELSELPDEDRDMFLEELGIEESGLDKLIKATYDLLGLATFFTAGKDECKAWTFRKGMKAPECAGIIHSDFEKGFIRAEVTSFEDYKMYGGEKGAKEAGRMRLEGKDYFMQDGDIVFFRFNV